jgi:hypothetical protein
MLKIRRLPAVIALFAGLAAGVDAAALGFGRAPQTAVLGQSLDFAIPLRLGTGESIAAECLSAEVSFGDRQVPPYQVRTSITPDGADAATVHVTTTPAVDEPVVTLTLTAGCAASVTRRFLLLADPPVIAATTMAVGATLPVLLAAAPDAAPRPAADTAAGKLSSTAIGAGSGASAALPAATPPGSAASGTSAAPARAQKPGDTGAQRQARKPSTTAAPKRRPVDNAAAAPVARLKLDVVEPIGAADAPPAAAVVIEQAIAVVAEAASAARASALAASAAAQRISALEQESQALRAQAQASRDEAARWREQALAAAKEQRWRMPLEWAVLLLAALCAWLAWRMRTVRQAGQRRWLDAAAAAPAAETPAAGVPVTAPIPLVNSELELPPPLVRPAWPKPMAVPSLHPAPEPSSATDVSSAAEKTQVLAPAPGLPGVDVDIDRSATPTVERTDALVPNLRFEEGAARDVSIEELLDLEQQAEFFVALGQDDAAIDLLVEHLRSTGGGSPLPYLKLLEIYHRRNEPQAYERTRVRFNDRFNAYAPDWDSDLQGGRSLEEYEGIVPRLQQAWPRPLDAMAELEALLFRKSRGELFDLPAYREVLFLYAVARDLREREPSEAAEVDILLPLTDAGTPSSPMPPAADAADGARGPRTTEPVDLDLSTPTSNDSLFGGLPDGHRPR